MMTMEHKPLSQNQSSFSSEVRPKEDWVKIKKYDSASDFLKDISYGGEMYSKMNNSMVYRGLKSGTYTLVSSVLREKTKSFNLDGTEYVEDEKSPIQLSESELSQRQTEYYNLRCFFDICDENGLKLPEVERIRRFLLSHQDMNLRRLLTDDWLPYDLLELAALAQHYGMKTRLLDWTRNIEIAIYFAINEDPVLNAKELENEDSKYVTIWVLNTSVEHKSKSLKFIRPPYWGNPNLYAQKGLFTYWQEPGFRLSSNEIPIDEWHELLKIRVNRNPLDIRLEKELSGKRQSQTYMWKLLIPRSDRKELWDYINIKGVNAASLFPGYAGVVRSIKESQWLNFPN